MNYVNHDKVRSSNKSILLLIFWIIFSTAKYYQDNKERLQKKFVKDVKAFLNNKKKRSDNMVMDDTKISWKIKNKSFLSIEKKILQTEKKGQTKEVFSGKYTMFFLDCEKLVFWVSITNFSFWRNLAFSRECRKRFFI